MVGSQGSRFKTQHRKKGDMDAWVLVRYGEGNLTKYRVGVLFVSNISSNVKLNIQLHKHQPNRELLPNFICMFNMTIMI